MSTTRKTKSTTPMRVVAGAILAAATMSGASLLNSATAFAEPPTDVGTLCDNMGGTYSKAGSVETCCFHTTIDSDGNHCMNYVAGYRVDNNVLHAAPVQSSRPAQGHSAV